MVSNKENDNSTLILLTIFFSIFLIFVLSVLIYDRFSSDGFNNVINNNDNVIINLEDKDLENIKIKLEDTYFLNLLISKNNIKEIFNNDLLYYLINLSVSHSQHTYPDNISINVLEELHKDSLLKNVNITHNDIYKDNNLLWIYDRINSKYIRNDVKDNILITPIFIKLDNIKKENNNYILSYRYAFKNIYDNNIYGKYSDCLNKTNSIYLDNSNNNEVLKQKLNNNYNNIKDKLDTYNYVVEVKDNDYILKDFNINK